MPLNRGHALSLRSSSKQGQLRSFQSSKASLDWSNRMQAIENLHKKAPFVAQGDARYI